MKRLLVLAPASTIAASTRFRLAQYFPALRAAGIEPILRPFLDDEGFAVLYRRGHGLAKAAAAARAVGGRLADVRRSFGEVDAVLIHREAALVGPPLFEWLMTDVARRPMVFDFDDPVWVPYVSPTYGRLLSRMLKMPWKTGAVLRRAARVIAGNEYLARYARQYGRPVDVVPTVVDTEIFRPPSFRPERRPLVLGWIGTHSSAQYLQAVLPALRQLASTHDFVVRIIGAELQAPGLHLECRPWSLDREVNDIQDMDIGLYPLIEDAWSLGKSGFKAVQYMACGVPLVASPVGVTTAMIRSGHNGFLATSTADWVGHLTSLLDDPTLRRRLADAGRRDAVERWSLAAHQPRVVDIIRSVIDPAAAQDAAADDDGGAAIRRRRTEIHACAGTRR